MDAAHAGQEAVRFVQTGGCAPGDMPIDWRAAGTGRPVAKDGEANVNDRSVLVIEDDPAIRGLIAELLDEAGYTVLEAGLGRGGLRLAEEHAPSVVLVNHRLPDMSGFDVLERLRRGPSTRRIPVVLVSGRIRPPADGPAVADRVLPMPFDIDVLLAHVEQLALRSKGAAA